MWNPAPLIPLTTDNDVIVPVLSLTDSRIGPRSLLTVETNTIEVGLSFVLGYLDDIAPIDVSTLLAARNMVIFEVIKALEDVHDAGMGVDSLERERTSHCQR
jgi:hypothetical protein